MVATAHWWALLGSGFLGLSLVGVTTLVFDVVAGPSASSWTAGAVTGLVVALWLVTPLVIRLRVGPGEVQSIDGSRSKTASRLRN